MYFLYGLSFVKVVPIFHIQIIRKGAHLYFAMRHWRYICAPPSTTLYGWSLVVTSAS